MSDEIGTALIGGRANYANPSHGSDYLAIRADRGTLVKICGDGGCWTTRSNDYGPVKATGDIADIALVRFAHICGWTVERAKVMGECDITMEFLTEIALPPTDTMTHQQLGQVESLSVITLALVGFSAFSLLLRRMRG